VLVSPGVAGLDRLRFSGLYLDGVGLNPPTSSWSFLSWPEDRRAPFWRRTGASRVGVAKAAFGAMSKQKPVEIDLIHC